MSDTFLSGSGFDTYETQDRVLVGFDGGRSARAAVRILQQQGFAVAGAVVKLSDAEAEAAEEAKSAAAALGIECVVLNAAAIAPAEADKAAAAAARLAALSTAADNLGITYIATGHFARIDEGKVLPPDASAPDQSANLAAVPADILARLILPLGDFSPAALDDLAAELGL